MSVYAKLKEGLTQAPQLCGRIIYPNMGYLKFEDQDEMKLRIDGRLDVLSQEEMDTVVKKQEDTAMDLVCSNWKRAQKMITLSSDKPFLEKCLLIAKDLKKEKIIDSLQERIEEL